MINELINYINNDSGIFVIGIDSPENIYYTYLFKDPNTFIFNEINKKVYIRDDIKWDVKNCLIIINLDDNELLFKLTSKEKDQFIRDIQNYCYVNNNTVLLFKIKTFNISNNTKTINFGGSTIIYCANYVASIIDEIYVTTKNRYLKENIKFNLKAFLRDKRISEIFN